MKYIDAECRQAEIEMKKKAAEGPDFRDKLGAYMKSAARGRWIRIKF